MLYVTTLDRTVTYTAQATLERATGPEGGLFVPMTLPQYDRKGLAAVLALPFWDCVASILNQFFPLRLQGSSLQGTEGVLPEPVYIRYKIAVAELWDRKTGSFQGLRSDLCDRLGSKLRSRGNWPFVAVDIALLFGLYGAACRSGWLRRGEPVQLAMASGEFTMPVAAWYARRMGLPLGDVICVCNENSAPWELLHRGELRLSSDCASTRLPLLDIGLPCNLERLVSQTLGTHTAELYGAVRSRRGTFSLNPEQQASLRAGFSVSVVSADRPGALIPRIFSTSDYLLSPYGALVYGGLMDYRALTGEGAPALLLAEESPLRWGEEVLTALGKPAENIVGQIDGLESRSAPEGGLNGALCNWRPAPFPGRCQAHGRIWRRLGGVHGEAEAGIFHRRTGGHHSADGRSHLGHGFEPGPGGLCLDRPDSRAENHSEGEPRLLVDHRLQVLPFLRGKRLPKYVRPPQQLLFL